MRATVQSKHRVHLITALLSVSIAIAVVASPAKSETVYDATNGNFFFSQTDLNVPIGKTGWLFTRTYNSLSSYTGFFGKGWCTTPETTLTLQPDGALLVNFCGQGKRISLVPDSAVSKNAKSLADIPLNAIYKNDEANLQRLKERIELSTNINEHYGFDLDGHLIDWSGPDNVSIKYQWSNNKLASLSQNELTFQVDFADGRIVAIKNKDQAAVYDYKDGRLAWNLNGWDNKYNYAYDKKGLLVKTSSPDGHNITATYDKQNRLTRLIDHEGCDTTLKYNSTKKQTAIKSICVSEVPWTPAAHEPNQK